MSEGAELVRPAVVVLLSLNRSSTYIYDPYPTAARIDPVLYGLLIPGTTFASTGSFQDYRRSTGRLLRGAYQPVRVP